MESPFGEERGERPGGQLSVGQQQQQQPVRSASGGAGAGLQQPQEGVQLQSLDGAPAGSGQE